jgi:hypothetical protein
MKKDIGFYFIPKKWLGDATILTMDWDCKAMHFHLMCIAAQQEKQGYLIDDENIFRRLLGNPEINDWNNRIKPQVFSAWKQKTFKENGKQTIYWYQPGLLKSLSDNDDIQKVSTKQKKKKNEFFDFDEPEAQNEGFDLKSLLKLKPVQTILYEKPEEATKEEKSSIWTLGVELLSSQESDEKKIRGFLARQIKQYGDKAVAQAIAQMSISSVKPADIFSYLIGVIKKHKEDGGITKKTGRGSVSL